MGEEKIVNNPTISSAGFKPNDALFHAEANALIRAANENGGSLAGQSLVVHTDRPLCGSCDAVLPVISRELGYPTVRFVDSNGIAETLINGRWVK